MNLLKLQQAIDKCQIISFDIFDTLVKRNVGAPKDVFDLVEFEFNRNNPTKKLEGFKTNRINIELAVRKSASTEDITMDMIYEQFPYDKETCLKLKNLELEVERQVIVQNKAIKVAYDYAIEKGKIVIAVSEMYLPAEFVTELLINLGYTNISKVYLSSEVGKLKRTGNLFRHIIECENYESSNILHIGDAKRSDWIMPLTLGMNVFPIRNHYNNSLYHKYKKKQSFDERSLYSFINNNSSGNRLNIIGYETLGPLLYGFCTWIHKIKEEKGLKRLLFLARDAQIIQKVYNCLYPEDDTEYIYVSRRALTVPLYHFENTWSDIVDLIPHATYLNISTLFERLGLDVNKYVDAIKSNNIGLFEQFPFDSIKDDRRLLKLYEIIRTDIRINSLAEYENICIYFRRINISNTDGIVDLGWKGTIQKCLENLFRRIGENVNFEGIYLGISLNQSNVNGFIYNPSDLNQLLNLRSSLGLIEMFFSSDHGSLLKYDTNGELFYPFEFDYNEVTKSDFEKIKQIQEGALTFVTEFSLSILSSHVKWNMNLSYSALRRLCTKPKTEDLKLLGNLSFYDTQILPLAKPSLESHQSFSKFKRELANSNWKIGYLKRYFKLPLPYMFLYAFLRSLGRIK